MFAEDREEKCARGFIELAIKNTLFCALFSYARDDGKEEKDSGCQDL